MEARKRYQRSVGGRTLKKSVFFSVLACVFILFQSTSSLAQSEDERARLLFDNGHQLYMEGRYEDALAAWTEAYALSQRPLILFNMANAYERNGQLKEAVSVLNRYRAYAQPDEQEVILRRIKNMEERQAQVAPLVVPTPEPTRLTPFPTAEVMFVSTGAVALVSGILLGSGAKNQGNLAAQYCGGPGLPCSQKAAEFLKKERRYALGADVCFVAGGLATAAGIGLLLLPKKGADNDATARVLVSPSTTGLVMHGTF